jgi:hypothetical protein
MALIIRAKGWRAMYWTMGSAAFTVGLLVLAFVKNPVLPVTQQESVTKIEEDEDFD